VKNPCEISLKTGFYNIQIKKDKYLTEDASVNILRGRTTDIQIDLKKNPTLAISPTIPPDENNAQKSIPDAVKTLSPASVFWNTAGDTLAFIDKSDDKLKVWDVNGGIKIITSLKNTDDKFKLYWSPDNQYLFGTAESDIYFIDIQKTTRKKMSLGFTPVNIKWSPKSEYLLVNDDENSLYKIDFIKKNVEPIVVTLPLVNAVWEKEGRLIFFVYDAEQKKTTIQSFDVDSNQANDIMVKYDFPVEKISSDKDSNIYFYNSDDKTWYTLNY
jgi:WD40 repeat protein